MTNSSLASPEPVATGLGAAVRRSAATTAAAASGVFLIVLGGLHVLRPDLAPSWHMISEYANGPYGALMSVAFFALATGFLALLAALVPGARGWLLVLGLVFLLFAGVGAAMGGLFPTDPPEVPMDHPTQTGRLHGLAFMLGVPGTLFGVTFINIALWRDPRWRAARTLLVTTAAAVWGTMGVFAMTMITGISRGAKGPEFAIGWPNRALVVAWAVWVLALALKLRSRTGAT